MENDNKIEDVDITLQDDKGTFQFGGETTIDTNNPPRTIHLLASNFKKMFVYKLVETLPYDIIEQTEK